MTEGPVTGTYRPTGNQLYANLQMTVFESMSQLAGIHGAINLGQGFPDDPGPETVRAKAAEASVSGWNQYPPMAGLPELRAAVADHYRYHQAIELDPDREVLITSGATEAIASAILALIEPGDEVVLFQPMYDAYRPMVLRAGGVPRYVTLTPPDWRLTEPALRAAITDRTRLIVFNHPINPAARSFSPDELDLLARVVSETNATVISDEVWEHVTSGNARHRSLLAVDGLRDRTIKVGSAGKIFSLTGWKVGFVCAAPELVRLVSRAHQYLTFSTPPNLQAAVAHGLALPDEHFASARLRFDRSRERLAGGLRALNWDVLPGDATYFLNVDIGTFGADDDVGFCQELVVRYGVAAIPVSAFYAEDHVRTVVRFCFAKRDETIDEALNRLSRLK
ncbi:MAG TPA: aminotransferase [Thermomicrobiales bacterium]|jgi:aspartate/methionine/tyrosine aminotransferase|nr:aminotransferase [Thermomicrobiales bacterium]